MSREQLFAAFFFAVFVALLYQVWLFLAPFFAPLVWAAVLALTFYPLTTWLTRAFRGSRTAAALVLVVVVITVVVLPSIYLGSLIVRQTSAAYSSVQRMATSGELSQLVERAQESRFGSVIERFSAPILDKIPLDPASLIVTATNWLWQQVGGQTAALAKNALATVLDFLLMLVALFFFFRDGERMAARIRELLPMRPEHKRVIFGRLYDTVTAVVQSMVVNAVAQGTLAGIGFWLFTDIPFAAFLGFLSGVLSLVPLAGPAFVWGGAAIYLAVIGATGQAIAISVWGVVPVSTVDNVIRPLFIGGRARLPTFLLLFALLGGLNLYGFLGVFLAPVILAILLAFTEIYREIYATSVEPPVAAVGP